MDPNQWAEIDRLFKGCREMPPKEREQYLLDECAVEEIRREVQSLLAHHSEQFLETPIVHSTRTERFRRTLESMDGSFEIERLLHESMTSLISLAREARSGRPVILKQARRAGSDTIGALDPLPPGCVKLLRVGTFGGRPTLIMEHGGVPVLELVNERGLDGAGRIDVFRSIARAVQELHSRGRVHGRIEPAHVLAREGSEVIRPEVLDSGCITSERDSARVIYLELRGVIGNAAYMAPEQVRCQEAVPQTDVYGLGCLLQELLTGRPAVELVSSADGGSAAENARVICDGEPGSVNDVVGKAVRKDPRERFASVGALLEAL